MHKKYASYIQLHLGTFYFSKPREFDFVQKNIFRKVEKWEELLGKLVLELQMKGICLRKHLALQEFHAVL